MVMKGLPSLAAALVTSGLMGLVLAASQEPVAVQAVPLPQATHTAVQRTEQINRNAARVEISTPATPDSAMPSASASASPSTQASAKAGEETGKYLVMPVAGASPSSPFGMRLHPITKIWKLHSGQDWAVACGTPIGAAANGVVTSVGWAGAYGLQIKISHGQLGGYDVVTTYNHLSATAVSVGQTVTARQAIGSVGSTGYSTGCHLHFEVVANGNFSDPMPWITGDPVTIDTTNAKMVTPSKTQTTGEDKAEEDYVPPAGTTTTPKTSVPPAPASSSEPTPTATKSAVTNTTPNVTAPQPAPTPEKTTVAPTPKPSVAPEPTKAPTSKAPVEQAPVESSAPETSSAAGS